MCRPISDTNNQVIGNLEYNPVGMSLSLHSIGTAFHFLGAKYMKLLAEKLLLTSYLTVPIIRS